MQILMIVGSEMGNAEMVGDLLKDELERLEHDVEAGAARVDEEVLEMRAELQRRIDARQQEGGN